MSKRRCFHAPSPIERAYWRPSSTSFDAPFGLLATGRNFALASIGLPLRKRRDCLLREGRRETSEVLETS